DDMIEATGVLDVTKKPVYSYLDKNDPGYDPNKKLYKKQDKEDYLRSTPTKEAYISMDDMEIMKTGSTGSTKPSVAWGKLDKFESVNDEGSSRQFIDNIEQTYLGNFYDKNTSQERNPFKATIKGMQRVDYDKLPNLYTGREFDNILFEIDPKYGESFVLPVSKEIQTAMPDIMKLVQRALIEGKDPFTREDIIKAANEVSEIRGYNDAYDKKIGFTSGGAGATPKPGGAGATTPETADDIFKKKKVNKNTADKNKPVSNDEENKPINKGNLPQLKVNVGDGKDYQRRMLNFENTRGSASGGAVGNYGFTGADMKSKFDAESGNKEEKALKVIDKYIIGQNKSTPKSILKDLGIDKSTFDTFPEAVKEQLVDWKFNTGRSVADLIYMASGKDNAFTGYKAHRSSAKTPSEISGIDISKLTKSALSKARNELYKGRIESMKDLLKEGKVSKSDLDFAISGYENSQKYRLQ
ncbi:MAG: hypothetical protein ACW98W_18380, partial [Candidatus Hodarchaeales archaeon]